MPENNTLIARRFLKHAYAMEMNEAIAMLSDDATWWVLGDPERVKIAGLKDRIQTEKMLRLMHKALPEGMSHRVIGTTTEGGRVAIEVEAQGKWVSGEPYRNRYHFLIQVEDGKITSIKEYLDTMQLP